MRVPLVLLALFGGIWGCQSQERRQEPGEPVVGRQPARQLTADESAFLQAAARGQVDKLKTYLAKGVSINVAKGGYTALHFAARDGKSDAVRYLVQAGSDLAARTDVTGAQPIHLAAISSNLETVQLLVAAGADYHSVFGKSTPLEFAKMQLHSLQYKSEDISRIRRQQEVVDYLEKLR